MLYSVPPFRLKAVPGADWVINMVGFGTLTPYAGWNTTGLPLDVAHGLLLLAFCPLFAALYPLTQIYQFEEDARRGDRTLARMLGVKRSLIVSCIGAALAFLLFGLAAVTGGVGPARPATLVRPFRRGVSLGDGVAPLAPGYRSMQPAGSSARDVSCSRGLGTDGPHHRAGVGRLAAPWLPKQPSGIF